MELVQPVQGTCFRIVLPVENPESQAASAAVHNGAGETGLAGDPQGVGDTVTPAREAS
jgi:hypothetical protein